MDTITAIVPCYNEEQALPYFHEEIQRLRMQGLPFRLQILFINDGSRDGTLLLLQKICSEDKDCDYISFSRNFGKEAAMYAGLQNAKGDYVAIMDADLQDPPSMLPEMYAYVKDGEYDSVATRRVTRKGEPPIRSWFARKFYKIMNKISTTELMDGARDYRLMSRQFVDALCSLAEKNRFSKGLFGWVGFKTKWLEFENVERVAGETKWSFWKLFRYALEGIIAFSTAPLALISLIGMLMLFVAFVFIVIIIVKTLVWGDPTSGWPSLACIVIFIGGMQMFCTGIIGQYLAKTYTEIKDRPVYIVKESSLDEL